MNDHTSPDIAHPLFTGSEVWVLLLAALAVWALIVVKVILDAALGAWTSRRRHLEPSSQARANRLADQAAEHTARLTGRPITPRERALLVAFYTPAVESATDSFYDQETDR